MKKCIFAIFALFVSLLANAQIENSSTEVIDYRESDGRIILKIMVNGVEADFLLDLAGHNALLPKYLDKFKIDRSVTATFNGYSKYLNKEVEVDGIYTFSNISFGNNISGNEEKFFLLKNDEPYLNELGVAGVINGALFRNTVLTIDAKRKKITTTAPYRPMYMKLDRRSNVAVERGILVSFTAKINGVDTKLYFDTWNKGVVSLCSTHFNSLSPSKEVSQSGLISIGYNKDIKSSKQMKGDFQFGQEKISNVLMAENRSLTCSVAGTGLLDYGILSIDFLKQKAYFQPHGLVEINDNIKVEKIIIEEGKLNPINRDWFIENIFDYRKGGELVSKYNKPVVIDFWATWCGPCMRLMPEMEAFAAKYKDKVIFLKVNADREKELCNKFGINALPTIFFIPPGGTIKAEIGASPEKYIKLIEEMIK